MPYRVLLVEDSSIIRATLIPALEELADMKVVGYAEDVAGALKAIGEFKWDVIVLDLFLKSGTGLDVLAGMPELAFSKGKVLVLTNYATADVRRQCLRLGASAVFDKSTEIEDFLEACAEM